MSQPNLNKYTDPFRSCICMRRSAPPMVFTLFPFSVDFLVHLSRTLVFARVLMPSGYSGRDSLSNSRTRVPLTVFTPSQFHTLIAPPWPQTVQALRCLVAWLLLGRNDDWQSVILLLVSFRFSLRSYEQTRDGLRTFGFAQLNATRVLVTTDIVSGSVVYGRHAHASGSA